MTEQEFTDLKKEFATMIFYASDFKDGVNAKKWWNVQFKELSKMKSIEEFKELAASLLEYTYDFEVYYVKEDVETMLKKAINA